MHSRSLGIPGNRDKEEDGNCWKDITKNMSTFSA